MIHDNILSTIGDTPLVRLQRMTRGLKAAVVVKVECTNPGGSVKDRIGLRMIEEAERAGLLRPGGTIIEGTSGNTGLGLAIAAAIRGYRCIFTMPDKMSREKVNLLKAFGAEVIVTPTAVAPDDPQSYYSVARRLNEEIANSFYPNQYANPANPQAHYETTGPEIWTQTEGRVTHFVAAAGTGGTISGAGRFLKEQRADIQVVGVDPVGSIYYNFFKHGKVDEGALKTYKVEGFGEDFFPSTMDMTILDDMVQVTDKECFLAARDLTRKEGIFAGGSGGGAVAGALKLARDLDETALIVVIIPDTGERYLSKIFNDDWMQENQYLEGRPRFSAGDILQRKVGDIAPLLYVRPDSLVRDAIDLIQRYEVSQIPVLEGEEVVGSFREEQMIECFVQQRDTANLRIAEVMDRPLPVVDEDASLEEISGLLTREDPAIVVRRADHSLGIVSKYDLVRAFGGRDT